ncbi:cap-specific mRNA (nucleoside-2'-O-)-methyltransferase 2-like [Watersipora subatra]|uniref:cap-specific mRNA (nucleoside-2'-O-)-methyltransferase 2-like n=1 Tax=Watersipora subatra TaxID=2589382 RepID=UPI00355C2258
MGKGVRLVVRVVTREINPKPFCSNAWCKFYELLSTLRLLDDLDKSVPFQSVHLCEAPGGFICALNHFVQSEYRGLKHHWLANTLNPYHEKCRLGQMIPDDRLIRHSLDKWLFGKDNTGDLTRRTNIDHVVQQAKQRLGSPIQLVTADGSLDCQLNPAEQEGIVYPLILAEVYTALSLLSVGGVLIVKMFTMFETSTIAVMYLLNFLFTKVEIHKPVTSKPGNSEVYVVCRDRKDTEGYHLMPFIRSALESGLPLFKLAQIPESFLSQLRAAAEAFKTRQVETILYNIMCYENKKLIPCISNEKNAREFLSRMNLKPLSPELNAFPLSVGFASYTTGMSTNHTTGKGVLAFNSYGAETNPASSQPRKRRLSGNFEQRCNTADERLKQLLLADERLCHPIRYLYAQETQCPFNHSPLDVWKTLNVIMVQNLNGVKDSKVYNSSFCDISLLADYNLLMDATSDILGQPADTTVLEPIIDMVAASLSDYQRMMHLRLGEQVGESKLALPGSHRKLIVMDNPLTDLNSLAALLKVMNAGDHLLIHNISCLLRLGAGVVYLLWHCFDEVAVAGHNSSNCLPSLLFKHSTISYTENAVCLDLIEKRLLSLLTPDWTALTLVTTPTIIQCDHLYSCFLHDVNNETLKRAMNDLVKTSQRSSSISEDS